MVMAMIRISGLGISVLGSAVLLAIAVGCDSGGTTTAPTGTGTGSATDTNTGAGGGTGVQTGVGGGNHTGGAGVATGTGGAHTGGAATSGTGGAAQGGGSCTPPSASVSGNCKTATAVTGTLTNAAGYITAGNYAGYGFFYISPSSDQTLTVACTDSTKGGNTSYFGTSKNSLCGAGIVPADTCYNAIGGIGFNLNQSVAGGTNSNPPISGTISQITVAWTCTTACSGLHIQVVQDATASGTPTPYCYDAGDAGSTSPLTLTASQFTTSCWSSAAPGTAWDGTNAQSFQFIIPSQATATTPFDLCITSVTITA